MKKVYRSRQWRNDKAVSLKFHLRRKNLKTKNYGSSKNK